MRVQGSMGNIVEMVADGESEYMYKSSIRTERKRNVGLTETVAVVEVESRSERIV